MFKLNTYSNAVTHVFFVCSFLFSPLNINTPNPESPPELTVCDQEVLCEFEELITTTYYCKWDNTTYSHSTQEECWDICYDCYEILYYRITYGYEVTVENCESKACKDKAWELYVKNHDTYVKLRNECIDKCNAMY